MFFIRISLATFIISLFLFGCATVGKDWKSAQETNSIQSFNEFLEKHPQSEYTKEAKFKIENLYWESAQESNSIDSYKEFLKKYPNSRYSKEALKAIPIKSFLVKPYNFGVALFSTDSEVRKSYNAVVSRGRTFSDFAEKYLKTKGFIENADQADLIVKIDNTGKVIISQGSPGKTRVTEGKWYLQLGSPYNKKYPIHDNDDIEKNLNKIINKEY